MGILPDSWAEWGACLQILQFVVVIVALLYAKKEVSEASKSRQLDATNLLISQIGNEEVREIRGWFLHNDIDLDNLSPEEEASLRKLAVAYDRIGFMIKQKYLPEEALYLWQKAEIIEIWNRIEPFILDIRESKNREDYCDYLEYLATDWIVKMKKKPFFR